MFYGIDAFFLEQARFRLRIAGMIVGVAVSTLALLFGLTWLMRTPGARRILRDVPILHWGYEGPEQYVRRIELKTESGPPSRNPGLQAEYIPAARRGGRRSVARAEHPNAPPDFQPPRAEEGDSEIDRLARARAQLINVPLVQSEELIIVNLTRPKYPEEARDRGIEGRVAVLALVDTTGSVSSVESVGSSTGGLLERAAEEAVWKCRFRPYRVDGRAQTVYALFRFSFRIY